MLNYWTRRSPFFECALRAGSKDWSVANHMYQPHSYDDPVTEYWHLVNGVTLWDVATERQVEIEGPDAAAFVDHLTPRDVFAIPPGKCRYVLVTSPEGGIVNDPVLLRLAEDRFWLSSSDSDLLLWAKGVAVHAGLDVTIREPDVSPLQVQGPRSRAVIQSLFGEAIAALPYYTFAETSLGDIPVLVSRTGWSGEFGYEVFLRDGRYAAELWDHIIDAGAPEGIAVTGPSDIRRVEAGILGYGCDIGLDVNPFEAGLERLLDLDVPRDFIGKPALLSIRETGATRRIVGLRIDGPPLAPGAFTERWPASRAGRRIGDILIALHSPRLAENIGYGMLSVENSSVGSQISIETTHGLRTGTVVPMPFVNANRS